MKEEWPLNEYDIDKAHRVAYLIYGHIRKTLTGLERRELDEWLEESEQNIELFEELTDETNIQSTGNWYAQLDKEKALQRAKQRIGFAPGRTSRRPFLSFTVAASLVLVIGTAVFLYVRQQATTPPQTKLAIVPEPDIPAGGHKAILTLADGRKISLDSTANGLLSVQGAAEVQKKDSLLSYTSHTETGNDTAVMYNILETPNGGQFKLVLGDGTIVWLNAASRLRYPTAFHGADRKVELSGEAYFEVAHDALHPFRVAVDGVMVEDLGTSFNINSYRDEGVMKTTLVEGAVKITKGAQSEVLRPGEEALVGDGPMNVQKADLLEATGWRRGEFVFHETPISSVMKQLERWYGITIENKENNTHHLIATIKRDVPLSRMLYYLEKTGAVRFEKKGSYLKLLP